MPKIIASGSRDEALEFLIFLNFIIWIWVFAVWIATPWYTAVVAGDKGYSFRLWFIGGLVFSLVALIAAAGLPDASEDDG